MFVSNIFYIFGSSLYISIYFQISRAKALAYGFLGAILPCFWFVSDYCQHDSDCFINNGQNVKIHRVVKNVMLTYVKHVVKMVSLNLLFCRCCIFNTKCKLYEHCPTFELYHISNNPIKYLGNMIGFIQLNCVKLNGFHLFLNIEMFESFSKYLMLA